MSLWACAALGQVGASAQPTTAQETVTATTRKAVQEAQQRLHALGYDPGSTDGALGPRTIAALKKFQSDHGLPVIGTLDQKTAAVLAAAKPSQGRRVPLRSRGDGETGPHPAVSEEDEWSRALQLNSADGYMSFYREFPGTERLAVLQGTLEGVMGGAWGRNGFDMLVFLKMNGSNVFTMPLEEAIKWDVVAHRGVEGGYEVGQRAPIPNARIIILKGPDKIISIGFERPDGSCADFCKSPTEACTNRIMIRSKGKDTVSQSNSCIAGGTP